MNFRTRIRVKEMREILFKAKKLSDGKFVKGSLVKTPFWTFIEWYEDSVCNKEKVDPSTVCQFTGLKDNDGNGIYEHDIISIFENREPCEVIFEKGCFIASNHVYGIHTALAKGIDYYDWKLCVIGNKFDKEK